MNNHLRRKTRSLDKKARLRQGSPEARRLARKIQEAYEDTGVPPRNVKGKYGVPY